MNPELLFRVVNALVLPFWILLVLFPNARATTKFVHSALPFLVLGAAYLAILVVAPAPAKGAGFASLEGVSLLFREPTLLLAGWVHYLAFDLFAGAWIRRDATAKSIPNLGVLPCLLLTFWFGPLGLTAYLVLRLALRKNGSLEASS